VGLPTINVLFGGQAHPTYLAPDTHNFDKFAHVVLQLNIYLAYFNPTKGLSKLAVNAISLDIFFLNNL
jgi:hypothetical protein